jgi:hypothetical protein
LACHAAVKQKGPLSRLQTAADVATARAREAEAALAALRGQGSVVAAPAALALSLPPAATAIERAQRAIAASDAVMLTEADMLIAAGAPQAGGAVRLQMNRSARGEEAAGRGRLSSSRAAAGSSRAAVARPRARAHRGRARAC